MTFLRFWPFLRDNLFPQRKRGSRSQVKPANLALAINGLALLVTAVTQTALRRLSLYHAIVVVHMAFFFNMASLADIFQGTTRD